MSRVYLYNMVAPSSEQVDQKNVALLKICHRNSEWLATFHLWIRGFIHYSQGRVKAFELYLI